jgi:hypothetical protein
MKKINFNRALVAKKKLLFFLLPALMLFAAGCKDKNLPEELPQTLSVNPELYSCLLRIYEQRRYSWIEVASIEGTTGLLIRNI